MVKTIELKTGIRSGYLAILTMGILFTLIILMLFTSPVSAAQHVPSSDGQDSQTEPTCTPPNDWGQTTRLLGTDKPTKEWSFTVDEPEMLVNLVFFYYQDFTKEGCPKDCSTEECQIDETGNGQSPFETFSVMDGKEGANRGSKQMAGRLAKGTYQVKFTANGNPGSINVGLKIQQEAVPTPTLTPTSTPTNTPIVTEITPSATNTPVTPEPTDITPEPEDTSTPKPKPKPTRTPPPTLPPPTPIPGSPTPQILIPETGIELGLTTGTAVLVLIALGLGIVGMGFTFYGIGKRLKEK